MDMVEEVAEEEDGVSALEEALPPGLILVWEEEDCRDVAISSVGAAGMPVPPAYPSYGSPGAMPYGGTAYSGAMPYGYAGAPMGAVPGADPYAPQMTREQELDFLKNQAGALESELDVIMKRLDELRK